MNKPQKLILEENGLKLGGRDFYLASGDMHYFRFFKDGWRRRLKLMKDFGLTCVQTYVPWNLHEPEEGQFDFSGNLDLAAFIRMCGEEGLYVLLRPSPYMCSEWDFGGLPWWLLKNADVKIRCLDESYMPYVERYTKRLCREFVPLLSTNGGPIIAVAVENEYGSYGNDTDYIRKMAQILKGEGVDVPLYTANGPEKKHVTWGSLEELWTGIDTREGTDDAKKVTDSFGGKKPHIVCEQWAGCAQQWGGVFNRQSTEEAVRHYKNSLERGYFVNFYMFAGGTNFGFSNGAISGTYRADVRNARIRYIPYATSYDVDAPLTEYGEPTEKYYALKKVLSEHLGKPVTDGEPVKVRTASYGKIPMELCGAFLPQRERVAEKRVLSKVPKTMEEISQGYGFILYETFLEHTDGLERVLKIDELRDRATVYKNGEYIGTMYRDRESDIRFTVPEEGMTLSILVENMGRICYGYKMAYDRKGITHTVHMDRISPAGTRLHGFSSVMNWTIYSLPVKSLENVTYGEKPQKNTPAFYKGTFCASEKADTFLKVSGGTKGFVFVNGFNLGRYWNIGPQETLYLPAELLKDENTVEVFELYAPEGEISAILSDRPSLDSIKENIEKLVQAERA